MPRRFPAGNSPGDTLDLGHKAPETDHMKLKWLGHSSFRLTIGDHVIYLDPYVGECDLPADLILCTHSHVDHSDVDRVPKKPNCETFTAGCNHDFGWCTVTSIPAYNTDKFRSPGEPFHPKGSGVGYIIKADGKTLYHAGDTDVIPEMEQVKGVDYALLPIGGTYTMDLEEAKQAQSIIQAKTVIPMHYNSLDAIAKYDKVPWSEAKQMQPEEEIEL